MKTLPTILALACLGYNAMAEDESADYLNFIIQIQSDAARTTHKLGDVSPEGNSQALEGVIGSSVFQLWTIHRTKGTEHLLDEKIVSSYHPQAEITIKTDDPYEGIPRTRVDQPFTVTTKVDGLVTNDPKVQDAAKSVIFEHKTKNYVAQPAPSGGDVTDNVIGAIKTLQGFIDKNGTTKETRLTTLEAADLTQASGEEEFTVFARPDFGVTESHMLAKAKVQIWPIARATMTGFNTKEWHLKLPNVHIDLKDLYPDSTTYVRVYKGKPAPNPKNPFVINTSNIIIEDTVPQDRKFSITGKELGITQKGRYTIEILHETPFGIDILSQTFPLKVKTGIKVIGSLNTSE